MLSFMWIVGIYHIYNLKLRKLKSTYLQIKNKTQSGVAMLSYNHVIQETEAR